MWNIDWNIIITYEGRKFSYSDLLLLSEGIYLRKYFHVFGINILFLWWKIKIEWKDMHLMYKQ